MPRPTASRLIARSAGWIVSGDRGVGDVRLFERIATGAFWYHLLVPIWYGKPVPPWKERTAVAISASEARSRLFPLIQQVNDDHVPVRINSKSGDVVLMSAADFDSWQETIYLLRSPANARRLMEAVARDKSQQLAVVKTMEELQALAGE
jgi:antitoxin YefM